MDQGPDLSALAPVWIEALQREGLTSPVRVRLWLDEHREEPSKQQTDMVLRRARGEVGVVGLAAEQDTPHSRIQTALYRASLEMIVPCLEEIASWSRARQSGFGDESIADLAGVRPELVGLALDGWPAQGRPASDSRIVEAYYQWIAGAPLAEIATMVGSAPGKLRHEMREGTSALPSRLHSRDIADRFGWNPATVTRHRRDGRLPPPDGRDGLSFWWWEKTIDRWVESRQMQVCHSCGSRYLTEAGLRGHITRDH